MSYKKNIDDMRESPSLRLINLLEARGAKADYNDPYIPEITPTREYPELVGRRSVPLSDIDAYDVVLISTDHDEVDYRDVVERAKIVVDTRIAIGSRGITSAKVVMA